MKPAAYILWIVLGFIFGLSTLIIGFVFDWVYGQDVDCIKNMYPCSEKEIPVFKKAIHNSADLRQQCAEDDETYNITGMCDPDDSDTGNDSDTLYCHQHFVNGTVVCHQMKMSLVCFDVYELYQLYIKDHKNDSENTILYPCPPFNPPHQEELK